MRLERARPVAGWAADRGVVQRSLEHPGERCERQLQAVFHQVRGVVAFAALVSIYPLRSRPAQRGIGY